MHCDVKCMKIRNDRCIFPFLPVNVLEKAFAIGRSYTILFLKTLRQIELLTKLYRNDKNIMWENNIQNKKQVDLKIMFNRKGEYDKDVLYQL